ncbi:hypothetical protein KRR26_10085 [Corallococcus sp. M34]|uniref:hypothetical protein n=1 Tax=Citreicoccus inhibens TaxID=2849499 RepID=UPI001C250E2A|nr:hypothetical protein [Citreicoccus inhibens]MBU8895955.1 hypothetical protein [Citreicoccus inhibens]
MKPGLSLLTPLLALAVLGSSPAWAQADEPIPEGCVEKRFCDGTQCYAEDAPQSLLACSCGLLDPTCGVGKCVEGEYCDGSACGETSRCHPSNSPISRVMCAGEKMSPTCELPAGGCGVGRCEDAAYCDGCGCQPRDAAASQALCECKLAETRFGLGECVNGGYCENAASESGQCFKPEADISRAMCRGATLEQCVASPIQEATYCKDGRYCDAKDCYPEDSAISKMNCAFTPAPQEARRLATALGPYDVGVIPRRPWACPPGCEYIEFYTDDEDSRNDNYTWGWVGATRQNNAGTRLGFCRVDGTRFTNLVDVWNRDLAMATYSVLRLGSRCPPGGIPFTRNMDNEDSNNRNTFTGNIWPNVSNRNTSLNFCLFMATTRSGMHGFPWLGFEYGVFAASDHASSYWRQPGYIHIDDEDDHNANSFSYDNTGNIGLLIHSMVWGGANTEMRLARVTDPDRPCGAQVRYHNGTYLTPWYDGANCYIKRFPPSGTPFIWNNSYYVSAGPGRTCSEGYYDGANCYIMTAPAGTTAFKWGNAFYYAE